MKPRTKFLIGGALIIGTAGYLAASAIKDTGVYYLTPGELSAKTRVDPNENAPEKYKDTPGYKRAEQRA